MLFRDTRDIALPFAVVKAGSCCHFFITENVGNLDDGVKVVGTLEEGVSLCEEGKKDYPGGPDVKGGRLIGTF